MTWKGGWWAGDDDVKNEEVGALAWKKEWMVNGCVIIASGIWFQNRWWMERGDSRWGLITRKLREMRWGQVRKTLTVIVPKIIVNDKGLGSDLWWRIYHHPIMIGGIT